MQKFHLHGDAEVHIYMGDITSINADAVVNVANNTLSNQHGLNKIIMECAGKNVANEVKRKVNSMPNKRLNFGDVLVSGSGKLVSKNIIHTVSVTFKSSHDSNNSAVQEIIQACLTKANSKKFKILAFPAIGTGLSRIRHMECADAYVNVLKSWKCSYPKEIHFVITKKVLLDKIQTTFACHFPLATVIQQSRNLTASSGGLLQDNHAVQTNNSAMAATSGAMAEVRPMDIEMSDANDSCPICLCDFTDKKTLDKCGHSFCSACIDHSFSAVGPYCPVCQTVYGKIIGQQPPGTMSTKKEKGSLPGFPECNLYKVEYEIPSGIQEKCHPNPGKRFYGAKRTAYLPSNKEGETVLKMLQTAFEQKLIFTVGDSRTTNMTDVVTWNDIHHKTNILGGPSRYGYPDPDYLNRVSLELEAKGITPADVFGQKIKPKISN